MIEWIIFLVIVLFVGFIFYGSIKMFGWLFGILVAILALVLLFLFIVFIIIPVLITLFAQIPFIWLFIFASLGIAAIGGLGSNDHQSCDSFCDDYGSSYESNSVSSVQEEDDELPDSFYYYNDDGEKVVFEKTYCGDYRGSNGVVFVKTYCGDYRGSNGVVFVKTYGGDYRGSNGVVIEKTYGGDWRIK